MAKFSVILPAAGKSERFGGEEKKTFAKIDGRAVFLRTIELFVSRADVCQIILGVSPEDMNMVKSTYGPNLAFMNVRVVEGGSRRVETVAAALDAVADESEFVAVHDAVRPCTFSDHIDAVFVEATKSGAAILACPITATLKRVSPSKVIDATVPRENLYEAQTPQVFRKDLLRQAYNRVSSTQDEITDDAQLVEGLGHPVSVLLGDSMNLKITTKSDLTLAGAILKARPTKKAPRLGAFEEAQW